MQLSQYTAPPALVSDDVRLGWLREAVKEGETFIRNTTAYPDFERAKQIIAGIHEAKVPQQLSRITVNLEKRLIRDIVATMSNLRPLWGYQTDNPSQDAQAEILNHLLLNWYQTTFADRAIKEALQYAAVYGTGWLGVDWKSDYWTRGRGDIILKSYSPEDVLPLQVPKDGNIQRAYAITFKEEVPINLARAMFPTYANKMVPDRQAPSGLRKGIGRMASFLSPVLNRFAADQKARRSIDQVFPVIDIYQTYILDLSVNEGPSPRIMGEPGTYWSYEVPVLGSVIPDGEDRFGAPRTHRAAPEDAALYPFRRLITWCNSCIMRDGPSYWWHGMVPAVQFTFDKWPWEFLGYSMTRDLHTIQDSNDSLRRAMDDSANARLRPPLKYDDRTISKSLMESLDTRMPGQAVGVDPTLGGDGISPIFPPQYYDIPPVIPALVESNETMMKYLSGVQDYTALAKANQIPASDTIEKIMEMAGPMVEDISRNMEAGLGQMGQMVKCLFFEFYTAGRRLQILGEKGLTKEDLDYFDPANLIPSHLPTENPDKPSFYSTVQRARKHMDSFFFNITPNSLHNITQMSRKLLYIQIQKAGVPIDPWTLAQVLDIPNFGRPPEGANTVFERWVAFEKIKGELTGDIQAKVQEIMFQAQLLDQLKLASLQAQATGGIAAAAGGAPGNGPPGPGGAPGPVPPQSPPGGRPLPPSPALGQNLPGRPPQFGGTPVLEEKDEGTRSTITSKK